MSATQTPTRKLKAAVLAVAASTAIALLVAANQASPAVGANGDALVLGQANWATNTTYLNWRRAQYPMPESGLAVLGAQTGAVFATNEEYVTGDPTWIDGIRAFGNDRGGYFYGVDVGAATASEYTGLSAEGGETGVDATGDTAVEASGQYIGLDVQGEVAIRAEGAVSFSSAGVATIAQGSTSALVKPGTDIIDVTTVLATAQTPGGQVLRVAKNVEADTVRIYLAAPATRAVRVGYFVIG